jgi:hypothetical protein
MGKDFSFRILGWLVRIPETALGTALNLTAASLFSIQMNTLSDGVKTTAIPFISGNPGLMKNHAAVPTISGDICKSLKIMNLSAFCRRNGGNDDNLQSMTRHCKKFSMALTDTAVRQAKATGKPYPLGGLYTAPDRKRAPDIGKERRTSARAVSIQIILNSSVDHDENREYIEKTMSC